MFFCYISPTVLDSFIFSRILRSSEMLPNPASLVYHKSKIYNLSWTLLHLEVESSKPSSLHPLFPYSRLNSTVILTTCSSHLRGPGFTSWCCKPMLCPTSPYQPPPTPSVSTISPPQLASQVQPCMLVGFLYPGCLALVTVSLCLLFLFPVFFCLIKALRLSAL